MPYFHQSVCISPQYQSPETDWSSIRESKDNLLTVIEPDYPGIPAGAKRRMGKSVRMAVGAALPLLEHNRTPEGIIIATANGGMEDCIKFLNQIIEYKEGLLTPANFVQSTSNAAAAQIALVTKNHQYNITHVHRGLAFENALLDVIMLCTEHPASGFLLGCTDEISAYNYNIDKNAGSYRSEPVSNLQLFDAKAPGTIAGEGSYMVWVDNQPGSATAKLEAVKTVHTSDPKQVKKTLQLFLSENLLPDEFPDLLLSGENGDDRLDPFYEAVENNFAGELAVARFKHACGEYCTATSFACWIATGILKSGTVPEILVKKPVHKKSIKRILIYNNYRGIQHGFVLMSTPEVDR